MKSIILVDDHELMRYGIKNWLEEKSDWKICGDASSISQCMECLKTATPSIVLVDIDLGKENGFDLVPLIRQLNPQIKIIMYSMHDESSYIIKAKELEVDGYISKGSNSERFIECLDKVYEGRKYLEPRLNEVQNKIADVQSILSKREFSIFVEMIDNKSNIEISESLHLSKHSVEVYTSIIYDKLFCNNRKELLDKYKRPEK